MTNGSAEALKQVNEAIGQSVQDRAHPEGNQAFLLLINRFADTADELPSWWTPRRDMELRRFWRREGILASTLGTMEAILSTVGWSIEGDEALVEQARRPLDDADFGGGLKETIKRLAEDYFTQDNGMFLEIIGPGDPTGPLTGMPTGIAHLDAGRCWRSGDPEYPVWYYNQTDNQWHKMHWTRVAFTASMPSADERARGVGFCAVSRVAAFATMMRDTIRYKAEKIGGRQTRAIMTISGANKDAVQMAVKEAELAADDAGQIKFSAIPIIASPNPQGGEVKADLLELASIPDGFDWNDELTLYIYIISLAFGIDARELWPATTSGATKADAEVQHRKAMRKGVGDFLSSLALILNQRVMPEGATFDFAPKDAEEDQAQADLEKTRIEAVALLVQRGILTVEGAITYLVNADVLPKEYLTNKALVVQPPDPDEMVGVADPTQDGDGDMPDVEDEMEARTQGSDAKHGFFRGITESVQAFFGKKNIVSFRTRVQATVRAYYKGQIETQFNFVDLMLSVISEGYRQAWLEGAKECGIKSLEELTPEEMMTLQGMINGDFQYVLNLATAVESKPHENAREELSSLYSRAELWVNRYRAVKAKGGAMACADKKKKFVLGPTEQHCTSCAGLDGRVYRYSVWEANNALPPSRKFSCGGHRCQCDLVDTEDRITPGRFPVGLLTGTF